MGYRLGIDLGTTYTAAAIGRDGRVEMATLGDRGAAVPSVLFLRSDGELLVGEAALRRGLTEPDRLAREFKRRLGDPAPLLLGGTPMPADALMGRLLGWVVDHVSSREGEPPEHVTVTHPANWGPYKRELLDQAIARSGVGDTASTMTEPEAAAIHYASTERLEPGAVVAVYDLGGGTFDAAVLRKRADGFDLLGSPEGLERTGGIDFDEAVFGHVASVLGDTLTELDDDARTLAALARLRDDCVTAKEALSSDTDVAIPVLLPTVQTEVRLTRGEFEAMIRPTLVDTVNALERALRAAGVQPADVHAILLVGGSSRIPLVGELVSRQTGRPIAVDIHPKHAVALGAARPASATAPVEDTTATVASAGAVPGASLGEPLAPVPETAAGGPPLAPPPAAEAPSRSRRPVLLAAAAAVVLLVVVLAVVVTQGGGKGSGGSSASSSDGSTSTSSDAPTSTEDTIARVPVETTVVSDGGSGQLHGTRFEVPSTPFSVTVGGGGGWVVAKDEQRVMRVDPTSNQVTKIVGVGKEPVDVAFGAGSVWTSNSGDGTVSRIDAASGQVAATIQAGGAPTGITASNTAVWVARDDGRVVRIDPATNQVAATIDLGGGAGAGAAMAIGGGWVWVSSGGFPGLLRIEEATGRVDNLLRTGGSPGFVTFGAGAVWVEDEADNTITRVDPDRFTITATIPINENMDGLAVSNGQLWASLTDTKAVARIDPASNKVAGRIPVGDGPSGLGDGEGTLWICLTNESKVGRLGP